MTKMGEVLYKVSGCSDCPMCDMNDFCPGYYCKLKERPDNFIKESKKFLPVTPKWCPIKHNDVILTMRDLNKIDLVSVVQYLNKQGIVAGTDITISMLRELMIGFAQEQVNKN